MQHIKTHFASSLSLLALCLLVACAGAPSQVVILPPPQAQPELTPRKPVRGLRYEPMRIVRPDIPAKATVLADGQEHRLNGWVHLAFEIDELGNPKKIRLLSESPEGVFSNAAIKALEKSRYREPTLHNRPTRINHVDLLYSFDHYGEGTVSCQSPAYNFINPRYIAPEAEHINQYEFTVSKHKSTRNVSPLAPVVEYPAYAAQRKIDGNVLLGFTVSSGGRPENLRVIEASPSCMGFAAEAIKAVERLKLQPEKNGEVSYAGEYYIYQLNFVAGRSR